MSERSATLNAPSSAFSAAANDTTAVNATVRPSWRMTSALDGAIVVVLLIGLLGMLTSRVDIVLLALPMLASAAMSLDRRPDAGEPCKLAIDISRWPSGAGKSEFSYTVSIDPPFGAELVYLQLTLQGTDPIEILFAARNGRTVTGRIPVLHSGRQRVVAVSYRLVGMDGSWLSLPLPRVAAERVVAPEIEPVALIPLPHRLRGLTGSHGSSRPGDGGEFRDLHPYASGDRLRRIDWKATARRSQGFGDLYVRRTDATSDATLILVVDSREDVGELVAEWSAGVSASAGHGSMDLAREAAASLAAAAIGGGDRVGLLDLAAYDGVVAPGSGRRQLDRLLRRIAATEPSGTRLNRRRAPVVPAGAIVYLISAFLDDEAMSIGLIWRAAGHRVVAVDVLPVPVPDGSKSITQTAHRILMAERRRRIAAARANGVEFFRWQEDAEQPSRAVVLRALARTGQRRR